MTLPPGSPPSPSPTHAPPLAPPADRYRALLERLDAWFARGKATHPGVIPCASGCSACCHGPFDISVADVVLLKRALGKLPPDVRADAVRRAEAQIARARRLEPGWEPPYATASIGEARFDAVCDALAEEPCPLLDDAGRCRIYEDRPLVCRLIGLPMKTPSGRVIENCCPILAGFPDYAKLPPREFDLDGFEEDERHCLRAAAEDLFGDAAFADYDTFIAAALVLLAGGEANRA